MLQNHFDAMLVVAKQRSLLLETVKIPIADRKVLKALLATAENTRLSTAIREDNLQKAMDVLTGVEFRLDKEGRTCRKQGTSTS